MPQNNNNYTFEISLSVLNHLGRNLYRSFITVLGEGISNSWDASADNVWIYVDRARGNFVIKDDGEGMDADDFQDKFLTIGYSKRKTGGLTSVNGRPYIGAKGIGKLALLSCADRVSIITKKEGTDEYVGGVIDNSGLDEAIEHEVRPAEYSLENVNMDLFAPYVADHKKGTIIFFENTKENIRNTVPYLKKLIALHFKFSLIDENFNIFVENELVTSDDLQEVADKTEFLWTINNYEDQYIGNNLTSLKESEDLEIASTSAQGFIASVEKPSHLKITGSEEKAGIDFFVNGRLREKDILKHMPAFSTRIVASYLYGQIHYNELDNSIEDQVFTSSREGIIEDNEPYKALLSVIKNEILGQITNQWDSWRLKHDNVGDEENPQKGKKERYARSLFNETAGGYKQGGGHGNDWINSLKEDAEFNIPAYTDCFLSENLLRMHIQSTGTTPTNCLNIDPAGNKCVDRNPKELLKWCSHCKAERGKLSLQEQKSDAGTAIQIRASEDDLLMYLDYNDLAKIIGNAILKDEDKPYKPIRNSVMHTALLTDQAKTKLRSVFDNVAATVGGLVAGH